MFALVLKWVSMRMAFARPCIISGLATMRRDGRHLDRVMANLVNRSSIAQVESDGIHARFQVDLKIPLV